MKLREYREQLRIGWDFCRKCAGFQDFLCERWNTFDSRWRACFVDSFQLSEVDGIWDCLDEDREVSKIGASLSLYGL